MNQCNKCEFWDSDEECQVIGKRVRRTEDTSDCCHFKEKEEE